MNGGIVVIDGDPSTGFSELNKFTTELANLLNQNENHSLRFDLKEKKIKSCLGCWDCWWKTPGICRQEDDAEDLLKEIINSEMLIFSSPMVLGMYSGLLKVFIDRMIPLLHPYIEIRQGECHHIKRYPNYPKLGVVLQRNDATQDEIKNVKYMFDRMALNFHSEIGFFHFIDQINPTSLYHEISAI